MKKFLCINSKSNFLDSNGLPIQSSDSVENADIEQIQVLLQTALEISDLNRFDFLGVKISEALDLITIKG